MVRRGSTSGQVHPRQVGRAGSARTPSGGSWTPRSSSAAAISVTPSSSTTRTSRTAAFAGGGEQAGRTCWAIDLDSVNPGMTRIKMAVDGTDQPGSPSIKHDFLVIWLTMSSPALTELSNTAFPGYVVGDPLGDGNFTPVGGAYKNGLIRARVTGSFTDLHGAARTLPADWASLAGVYAFDTSGYNPMAWDIHDDDLADRRSHLNEHVPGVPPLRSTPWTTASAAGEGIPGRFSRPSAAPVISSARPSARSTRQGRIRPSCRTASWTPATHRCRPLGSTSRSPALSVRSWRPTSTCSTAATGPALHRLRSRTTRITSMRRSTSQRSRRTGSRFGPATRPRV